MLSWHTVCSLFPLNFDSSVANETLEPICPLPKASGFFILFLALISYSCSVPGVSSHLPSAKPNSAYSRNLSNPYRNSCSIRLLMFLFKIHHLYLQHGTWLYIQGCCEFHCCTFVVLLLFTTEMKTEFMYFKEVGFN